MERTTGTLPVADWLRPSMSDEAPDLALLCTRIPPSGDTGQFYAAFDMQVVPLALVAAMPIEGEA